MSAPAIELTDVRKNFGRTEIIRGVNLSIPQGERHAIIGPNGAGKTTLFNLISRALSDHRGRDHRQRAVDGGPRPAGDQPARAVAQLPDHLDLPAHDRVREHPLRLVVVARLSLFVLAALGAAEGAERRPPNNCWSG